MKQFFKYATKEPFSGVILTFACILLSFCYGVKSFVSFSSFKGQSYLRLQLIQQTGQREPNQGCVTQGFSDLKKGLLSNPCA